MVIEPGNDTSSKKRILVVDDHEDNVEVLRARLEARGYEVEGAINGQQALDTVDRWCPDLVLLDVMMPDMDGLEVVNIAVWLVEVAASLPRWPLQCPGVCTAAR